LPHVPEPLAKEGKDEDEGEDEARHAPGSHHPGEGASAGRAARHVVGQTVRGLFGGVGDPSQASKGGGGGEDVEEEAPDQRAQALPARPGSSPYARHGILRFQGRPPQLLPKAPVKKRNERKEDKGLRNPQHHQRSDAQPHPAGSSACVNRGEGGGEGGERTQCQHGDGPESGGADDGAPFPHLVRKSSSEEGEDNVHVHLRRGGKEGRKKREGRGFREKRKTKPCESFIQSKRPPREGGEGARERGSEGAREGVVR